MAPFVYVKAVTHFCIIDKHLYLNSREKKYVEHVFFVWSSRMLYFQTNIARMMKSMSL
jgi:hypothetical protein